MEIFVTVAVFSIVVGAATFQLMFRNWLRNKETKQRGE